MNRTLMLILSLSAVCGPVVAADKASPPPPPAAPAQPPVARVVNYSEKDVVPVKAKVRYTTLIVLPKQESIVDYTCGDKEFWVVNGTANFAYVKPAKEKSDTNLNLITASGNVYSFVLHEISDMPGAEPDLKIFLQPKEDSMLSAINSAPKFVSAAQVEDYRQQIDIAKQQARDAKAQAQATIDQEVSKIRADYPEKVHFSYRFASSDKLFRVAAIYNDGKFTYIHANPQETPALYEIKEGKPNLVEFQFKDGVYVVPKVLESGYLAIGKRKLTFTRED